MQLVAYGAQDIYLTGNPQITFFKVVYRRHTNFSMEAIEQTINGSSGTTSGGSGTVTISRNGDLVHKIYVTSEAAGITDGSKLIVDVELEIGGQRIDRHYREWMQIWNELSTPESKAIGLKSMQGCIGAKGSTGPKNLVQVPLQFWFCRNPGLALPLIALQYHEVKLKFNWGGNGDYGGSNPSSCKVICDYIYLDTDERRRFAQVSHEYLIEQVQRQTGESGTTTKLNFNHPVKELIWTTDGTATTEAELRLKLNGHDRFSKQQPEYFQLRQPYDYHTAVPAQNLPSGVGAGRLGEGGITDIKTVSDSLVSEAIGLSSGAGSALDAVGSGDVKYVLTDTTTVAEDGTLAAASTFSALSGGAHTPDDIVYVFNDDDLNRSTLEVGDTVLITLSGATSFHTLATAQSIVTTVRSITDGDDLDKLNTADVAIQFTSNLTNNEASTTTTVIHSIQKIGNSRCRTSSLNKKINVYSFGLKPEEHQPSGTCNFSRIDVAQLIHEGNASLANETVYAVNYNVLRIMSGMGGLAYSN